MAEPTEQAIRLKPVRGRKLRDGMWVVVADGSEPLVVSEPVAHALRAQDDHASIIAPLAATLSDAGFMCDFSEEVRQPPAAPVSGRWKVARATLWVAGAALCPSATVLLLQGGIPTGADVISAGSHPLLVIAVALALAITTAVSHELAHIGFGRRFARPGGTVRIRVLQAAATTNLTHVWAWPLSPRLSAVAAGVVVDFAFLTTALAWRALPGSWIATVAVAVMVLRLVWQFRFHRNCDGRHMAKMLLDAPTIDTVTRKLLTARLWTSAPITPWLWLALVAVGALAELALLAIWLVPAILRLLGVL
ncbi:hypothetical protein [Auritidibacter ignavus]|uniref:hypothetical protein n=1 Tax=Auritidibacter ignavus TaxID=678932 RepID=UPI0024471C9B|nr:hypothetical protein [Auritidibacter ignavus]WGH86849.1 hypothetical protein QDX24_03315 [Auritidibacter ignavus]WGH89133.1 hypothetical protein QDX22_03310 [Auritidibacter ignavus]WHS34721.1 hypothetical protein QM403_10480 [Auritidibacter ignavus]